MSNEQQAIRILIVDDVPETRDYIGTILSFERDFRVVGTATNGREALDMAIRLQPDVILMDIYMPVMDGLKATAQIAETIPAAALIVMTALDPYDSMRRAMLVGARGFIPKPPDPDELYRIVRTVHDHHTRYYARLREIILTESHFAQPGSGETIEPTSFRGETLRASAVHLGLDSDLPTEHQ